MKKETENSVKKDKTIFKTLSPTLVSQEINNNSFNTIACYFQQKTVFDSKNNKKLNNNKNNYEFCFEGVKSIQNNQ